MPKHSAAGGHAPPAAHRQDDDWLRDDPITLDLVEQLRAGRRLAHEVTLDPHEDRGRAMGAGSTAVSSPRAGTLPAGVLTMAMALLRSGGGRVALVAGALAGSIGVALALVMLPSGPAPRHVSAPAPSAPVRPVQPPATEGASQLGAAAAEGASSRPAIPATVARAAAPARPAAPVSVRYGGGADNAASETNDGNPDNAAPEPDDGGDSAGESVDSGGDSSDGGADGSPQCHPHGHHKEDC